MSTLSICDDKHTKTKKRAFGDKFYINFRGCNAPEDEIKCKSFAVISIGSLLVYEKKYYQQVYLGNRVYRIVDRQMIDFLGENLF